MRYFLFTDTLSVSYFLFTDTPSVNNFYQNLLGIDEKTEYVDIFASHVNYVCRYAVSVYKVFICLFHQIFGEKVISWLADINLFPVCCEIMTTKVRTAVEGESCLVTLRKAEVRKFPNF